MNPLASLCSNQVYGIPLILVIGWRGESGVADEPQHVFQGEVTLKLLNAMNVIYCIIDSETREEYVERVVSDYRKLLAQGRQVAFVVRKGALSYEKKLPYRNSFTMRREESHYHRLCRWFIEAPPGHFVVPPIGGVWQPTSTWPPLKRGNFSLSRLYGRSLPVRQYTS